MGHFAAQSSVCHTSSRFSLGSLRSCLQLHQVPAYIVSLSLKSWLLSELCSFVVTLFTLGRSRSNFEKWILGTLERFLGTWRSRMSSLWDAYRSMSHELHKLQVEEEMLMRKFYELMSAQASTNKNDECSDNVLDEGKNGQSGALIAVDNKEQH